MGRTRLRWSGRLGIAVAATAAVACAPQRFESSSEAVASPVDGANRAQATETFYSEYPRKADILIVADNSGSMLTEQRKMAARFASFIGALTEVDYHIGVTTTDVSNGSFGLDGRLISSGSARFIQPTTPDANDAFLNLIQRPETENCASNANLCPSGNEQALYAAIRAIARRNGANEGFFRPQVDLSLVILSDEDEKSNRPAGSTEPADVVAAFASAFGTTKRLQAHAIVIPPGDSACKAQQDAQFGDPNDAFYGSAAAELAVLTGGTVSSICADDYAANLSVISETVRDLTLSFDLDRDPIAGSVRVGVDPPQGQFSFTASGRRIRLDRAPSAGSRIDISYAY